MKLKRSFQQTQDRFSGQTKSLLVKQTFMIEAAPSQAVAIAPHITHILKKPTKLAY
jgi:hypothetical protein